MRDQIIAVLKDTTGLENITEDMRFGKDIIVTSISIMKIVYDLEEKLDIKDIPIRMMYDISTVKELIDFVEECK